MYVKPEKTTMKRNTMKAAGMLLGLLTLLIMSGCGYLGEYEQSPYQHIFLEEEAM